MCDIPLGVSSERAPALPALADARLYIMYGNPQRRSASEVQDLRREGGRWLKEMREAVGLSQRQLAAKGPGQSARRMVSGCILAKTVFLWAHF